MNVNSWLASHKETEARIILAFILGKDPSFLVAHPEYSLTPKILAQAEEFLLRRKANEPLAYILGYREFYGRKFLVSPAVLIPRPESELIVDLALEITGENILDIGAGSGCIGITLKLERPEARVVLSDTSSSALDMAKKNSQKLGAEVKFLQADLLDGVLGRFDIIVANLPYVDKKWDWINQEALKFEPEEALYAEDDGLFLIKRLISEVKNRKQGRYLVLEADPVQHEAIIKYALAEELKHIKTRGFGVVFKV